MNKKTQKGLVSALAAVMSAGLAAPVFASAATTDLGAEYKAAYDAVQAALKSNTQKDLTAARVLVDALYTDVKGTPDEYLATTLSSLLDPAQQVKLVEYFVARDKAVASEKQADINAARELLLDMPQVWRNSYSTDLDKTQQNFINKVVASVETAEKTGLQADIDAAKALVAELATVTNNDGVKAAAATLQTRVDNVAVRVTVTSISAVNTTTVTVVLDKAPAADLTAKNFVVAGNTVTNAVKGSSDTIYTLTLGTSLDNTKGTLNVNGVTKDYDFTQLKINSVKALNLRQLQVNFSKAISVAGIAPNADGTYTNDDLLKELYIGIANEVTGDITKNSIAKLVGAGAWTATVSADAKSVVIEEKAAGVLITDANAYAATPGTGLGLKLNENYEVEARNILDSTGKYEDVSYVQQLLVDNERPTVSVGNLDNTVLVDATPANMKLDLTFSEPMKQVLVSNNANSKVKIYIDGNEVSSSDITDVVSNASVADQELVQVAVGTLTKGTHTVAVVGAVDLNDNLLSNNSQSLSFTITDPADAPASIAPVVNNVTQVADNAFKVVFNTTNVRLASTVTAGDTVLTIKNGEFVPSTGLYKDIELTTADFDGTGSANYGSKKIVAHDVAKTATTPAHTEWIVVLPATATVAANDTDAAGVLAYKGANVITKDVVVNSFGNTAKDGKATTKSTTLKKDTTAPVIDTNADGTLAIAKKTGTVDTIKVKFTDAPFATDGNGKVDLGGQKVTVKYTDKDGVTYSQEVAPGLATTADAIELTISNPKMLTTDGTNALIPGAKYTVVLPDGVVKDAQEDLKDAGATQTNDYMLLDGAHPFVGRTVDYTVPGAATTIDTVPQTTKGLIFTGAEVKASTAAIGDPVTLATSYVDRVKSQNALVLKDNQIVVVFDGDVNPATATNTANYLLNGKVLPTGSTIEFRKADIDAAVVGDEAFALITLADNTITLTGGQDFAVSGVANKAGNKMMPVTDIINLTDNTAPKLSKVEVKDSNKLVLTFPEVVNITTADMTQLASNFKITANGKVISLLNATVDTVNKNQIVVTTADNFDNNGSLDVPVTVELKLNADGNMFITDNVGNKAASVVVNK